MNSAPHPDAWIIQGDARERLCVLPDASVRTCVTSPPYFGLRDYGVEGQMGLEKTPEEYVAGLVDVFRQVRRVLTDDGTLWLNLGDSYWNHSPVRESSTGAFEKTYTGGKISAGERRRANGHDFLKMKDLIGIPWRAAFALQADGWYLRQDIIWHKPNPMPESVTDRCTKAHEYIFLLSKSPRYYFDSAAMQEPAIHAGHVVKSRGKYASEDGSPRPGFETHVTGERVVKETRNRRSVWTVTTKPFKGAHFATFPMDLITPCVLAGSAPGDTVLDPFNGSGTTGIVATQHGRRYVGIELNPEYVQITHSRFSEQR